MLRELGLKGQYPSLSQYMSWVLLHALSNTCTCTCTRWAWVSLWFRGPKWPFLHLHKQQQQQWWCQRCDLTKVIQKSWKMGSGPGSPFGLEDKAPWTSWMFNLGRIYRLSTSPQTRNLRFGHILGGCFSSFKKILRQSKICNKSWHQEKSQAWNTQDLQLYSHPKDADPDDIIAPIPIPRH